MHLQPVGQERARAIRAGGEGFFPVLCGGRIGGCGGRDASQNTPAGELRLPCSACAGTVLHTYRESLVVRFLRRDALLWRLGHLLPQMLGQLGLLGFPLVQALLLVNVQALPAVLPAADVARHAGHAARGAARCSWEGHPRKREQRSLAHSRLGEAGLGRPSGAHVAHVAPLRRAAARGRAVHRGGPTQRLRPAALAFLIHRIAAESVLGASHMQAARSVRSPSNAGGAAAYESKGKNTLAAYERARSKSRSLSRSSASRSSTSASSSRLQASCGDDDAERTQVSSSDHTRSVVTPLAQAPPTEPSSSVNLLEELRMRAAMHQVQVRLGCSCRCARLRSDACATHSSVSCSVFRPVQAANPQQSRRGRLGLGVPRPVWQDCVCCQAAA